MDMTHQGTVPLTVEKRQSAISRHLTAYLFLAPWILGFLFFTLGPLIFSLTMSFHDWPVVGERTFVGFDNYRTMLFDDPQFWDSLWITVKFAAFYLPSVISGVALVTIWSWIYSREYGLLNFMLSLVGIDGPNWLGDPGLA